MTNTELENNTHEALPEPMPTVEPTPPTNEPREEPLKADWWAMEQEKRATELRAAAHEAEEAAEKLATAAGAVEKTQSLGRTLLNAAAWAGTVVLVSWGLTKLVSMAEEATENRERFPRGTEDANTEPATAQRAGVSA